MRFTDLLQAAGQSPRAFRESARRALLGARVFANLTGEKDDQAAVAILEAVVNEDNAWNLLLSAAWRPAKERS